MSLYYVERAKNYKRIAKILKEGGGRCAKKSRREHPGNSAITLKSGEVRLNAKKPPYPELGNCKLCGGVPKVGKRDPLLCHHWDDFQTMRSLYVCRNPFYYSCHVICEMQDKNPDLYLLIPRYLKLKEIDRSKEPFTKGRVARRDIDLFLGV